MQCYNCDGVLNEQEPWLFTTDRFKVTRCIVCTLWHKRAQEARVNNQVRIDGVLYLILRETRTTRTDIDRMDYAHHIEFKSTNSKGEKRKVFTTNLARIGKIPEYWLKFLPDNAKFIALSIKEDECVVNSNTEKLVGSNMPLKG